MEVGIDGHPNGYLKMVLSVSYNTSVKYSLIQDQLSTLSVQYMLTVGVVNPLSLFWKL